MNIVIGTTSLRKIDAVKKVLQETIKQNEHTLIPFAATSQVSETPWDRQTYDGSRNRALHCKEKYHDAEYFIGIESGLVDRYANVYEEVWCCVLDRKGNEYFGYSSGLRVPDFILEQMRQHNLPHYLIFSKLNDHLNKDVNADTWAQYSGNLILREVSIEEAVRNALVQVFAPEKSYYRR